MPGIEEVLQEPHATDAIVRMLHAGTARHFKVEDFSRAFESFSCSLCQSLQTSETDAFATDICLLRCCRVCRSCALQEREVFFLPTDMVRECFKVDLEDSQSEGTGRAQVLEKYDQTAKEKQRLFKL
jgi:hypothetical protein